MENKFKVGDRVQVVEIDNMDFYGRAIYHVGDVGTIDYIDENGDCRVDFDRLKLENRHSTWWAREYWLRLENQLMMFE